MNRNTILIAAMIICALALAAAGAMALSGVFGSIGYGYSDADKYAAGDAEIPGDVRNLDIHWISGKISVAYHPENTIILSETADKPLSEDMKLRWRLDGDTLRVQFAGPALRLSWNIHKELTLTLPQNAAFQWVSMQETSGDMDIPSLQAKELSLRVTSGAISAYVSADIIRAEATSGSIRLRSDGTAEEVSVSSTSGDISLEADSTAKIAVSSTSGSISVRAKEAGELQAGSTSGGISAEIGQAGSVTLHSTSGTIRALAQAVRALRINTTSGSVSAFLPENPGFTARLGTTSGSVDYALPLNKQESEYVCGDGSGSVDIHTTSGNIRLERLE